MFVSQTERVNSWVGAAMAEGDRTVIDWIASSAALVDDSTKLLGVGVAFAAGYIVLLGLLRHLAERNAYARESNARRNAAPPLPYIRFREEAFDENPLSDFGIFEKGLYGIYFILEAAITISLAAIAVIAFSAAVVGDPDPASSAQLAVRLSGLSQQDFVDGYLYIFSFVIFAGSLSFMLDSLFRLRLIPAALAAVVWLITILALFVVQARQAGTTVGGPLAEALGPFGQALAEAWANPVILFLCALLHLTLFAAPWIFDLGEDEGVANADPDLRLPKIRIKLRDAPEPIDGWLYQRTESDYRFIQREDGANVIAPTQNVERILRLDDVAPWSNDGASGSSASGAGAGEAGADEAGADEAGSGPAAKTTDIARGPDGQDTPRARRILAPDPRRSRPRISMGDGPDE